ncbi:MAG: uroporphyrinogen-III C-methyltransferase [Armatimonadota bacterium]
MKGKVYLVGAGPGDTKLLTLRGKELIENADVIIYDRLISEQIFDFAGPGCEKIYVGKEAGAHSLSQDKIEKLLYNKAAEGKKVIRLKGGDPYLFGRGAEEALYLADKKIDFEVVPGVTSAIAGPAYGGIPVTHRDDAYMATFVTGHRAGALADDLDWDNLAKNKGTLVFLMGVKNLGKICANLIKHGKDKKTPAAIISMATYPVQKKAVGTLSDIKKKAESKNIASPAVIIIGGVVKYSNKLDWFSKKEKKLAGKNILITRAREKQSRLNDALAFLGANPLSFPVIRHAVIKNKKTNDTLKKVDEFDYLVFTSPTTIDFLIPLINDIRCLKGPKICALGPGTKRSLEEKNLKVGMLPKEFIAEGLLKTFKNKNIKNKRFLIIRSSAGRDVLPEGLKKLGAEVTVLNIYKTMPNKPSKELIDHTAGLIKNKEIDLVVFMSASQVENFTYLLKKHAPIKGLKCACIGPVAAEYARRHGYSVKIEAKQHCLEGLIGAVVKYYSQNLQK